MTCCTSDSDLTPAADADARTFDRSGTLDMRWITSALLFIFVLAACFSAVRKDVTKGFDELAHISYVAEVQQMPGRVRLDQLRMLDPVTFQFNSAPNYLNHSPAYYRAMAVIGTPVEGHPGSILRLRLVNVVIAAFGLGLLFSLSLSVARSTEESLILVVPIFCIPILSALAGSVNNDNLAFAGGAMTLFGSWRFLEGKRTSGLGFALAGLVACGAAKLTALILCGGYLMVLAALARPKLTRLQVGLAAVAFALALWPYVALWLTYGSPAPDTPGLEAQLLNGAAAMGWASRPRLGVLAYTLHFAGEFIAGWKPLLTQRTAIQTAMLTLPAIVLLMAAAGLLAAARTLMCKARDDRFAMIVVAGSTAIAATLLMHMGFSYRHHLQTGWLMDAYPRYYLPLMFVVPMATLALVRSIAPGRGRTSATGFLIAAPILFGLFG